MAKKASAKMGSKASCAGSGKMVMPKPMKGNGGQVTSTSKWPKGGK